MKRGKYMTEVKLTKAQYEDFKQAALDKFSEKIEKVIEETIKEEVKSYMNFEFDPSYEITEYLSNMLDEETIDKNFEHIAKLVSKKDITEKVGQVIFNRLTW